MTAKIIDGKQIAKNMAVQMVLQVDEIKNNLRVTPTLVVILVGNDPASEVYVRNKSAAAKLVGIESIQIRMDSDIKEGELINKINELNRDNRIHGILVQLPLPKHIDTKKIIRTIDCRKDVDGFHIINVGKLSVGEIEGVDRAIVPCTPMASLTLLKSAAGENLVGMKVLVIGSSNIVGRPLARLLMLEGCTVTIANSSTKDLKAECMVADVIFSAAGVPNLVKGDMVKPGAAIIDIGINRVFNADGSSKLVGDVDFESVKEIASAITPVPGGVGPMTISYLLSNTIDCCVNIIKGIS